ncbi:chromatin-binding/pre-rRNA-processing protein IPI3 KNAG_0F01250 [Huiozyma naganishii CBS 8797]|uniref:Pre-rRNA-processing protein IPI3 n=1 Tax=Huiozyma naganishii (strain ATCC MYA-139 / BCRC 22969 / CBS 8797 / KCTC 17520 / NBRC 10181 / NCYC 3082 / Yp74L-3) TaxID=1071383 RepID=J7RMJ9_HUIN7|nr:hypothetical protein KNAG_0F01250 [Kazachstania naganishii CBS 8797]CCK70793.1 hypothetical protein KNAG_0F01250 [Kazachstania naganishii CBS 8797]
MDEQVVFTTNNSGCVSNVHSFEQANLRQCNVGAKNSAVLVGADHLFVAQGQKALINVYDVSGSTKRESVEQRLPLPESVNCLEVVDSIPSIHEGVSGVDGVQHQLGAFHLPYLLLASTESGKLYVWELNSGVLLNVKQMAHYQNITKIKSVLGGKYIITSGMDSRVIVWQTVDLVSQEDPKPVAVIHDHTLPVTDFEVSCTSGAHLTTSGLKLFTTSLDSTVRCYDLNLCGNDGKMKYDSAASAVKLVATFSLPHAVHALALDPADRAIYLGTADGCYQLALYYKLNGTQMANLTQLSNNTNKGKLYSVLELNTAMTQDRNALFSMGQLVMEKVIDYSVEVLRVSLDGTVLLVGDSQGRVSITEIYSKQILRTLQALTTQDTLAGKVTNILLNVYSTEERDRLSTVLGSGDSHNSHHNTNKIPNLQRSMYDRSKLGQLHEIWFQTGAEIPSATAAIEDATPLSDLDAYLDHAKQQELVFQTVDRTGSEQIRQQTPGASASASGSAASPEEVARLQEQVHKLTEAYKELRSINETLLRDRV